MAAKIINALGEKDKPKGAPGVAVALVMEKIAQEIAPLFAEGKIEIGGNRAYHDTRDSSEMDFTKVTLYHKRKWYNLVRVILDAYLVKDNLWVFEVDSASEEPIKEKLKILFKKYQAELSAHKIKAVLK